MGSVKGLLGCLAAKGGDGEYLFNMVLVHGKEGERTTIKGRTDNAFTAREIRFSGIGQPPLQASVGRGGHGGNGTFQGTAIPCITDIFRNIYYKDFIYGFSLGVFYGTDKGPGPLQGTILFFITRLSDPAVPRGPTDLVGAGSGRWDYGNDNGTKPFP